MIGRPKYVCTIAPGYGSPLRLECYSHEPSERDLYASSYGKDLQWIPGGATYRAQPNGTYETKLRGGHLYVREIAPSAAVEIEQLNARISDLHRQLRALNAERQELLAAAAVRGKPVKARGVKEPKKGRKRHG